MHKITIETDGLIETVDREFGDANKEDDEEDDKYNGISLRVLDRKGRRSIQCLILHLTNLQMSIII